MNTRVAGMFTLFALFLGVASFAQETQPPAPAVEAPRVVGEARSEPEKLAWQTVYEADQASKKGGRQELEGAISAAQKFLEDFPESGMTSHAHYVIAMSSFRKGDYASFTMHGEEALNELVEQVDLSAQLAYYYAERKRYDDSIAHAETITFVLEGMENPGQMSEREWVQSQDQLTSTVNYALGRSYLGKFVESGSTSPEDPNLTEAITYLENAIESNPADDYSYFRLGDAYRAKRDLKKAAQAYARAAAVQGNVAAQSRIKLESIYDQMKKKPEKIDEDIAKELAYLQKKFGEKQVQYQKLNAQPPS